MKTCSFSSITRSGGKYDIVTMVPYAILGVAELTIQKISNIQNSLSLSGTIPKFSPLH